MRNLGSIMWGILLIVFGVVLGGNALDIWHIDVFFPGWWTLFIIVPAVINIAKRGFNFGNTMFLVIGLMFLVSAWDIFSWGFLWKLILPGFLVIMGIFMLFGFGRSGKFFSNSSSESNKVHAFCSSGRHDVVNEPYYGGKVDAALGSAILNLSCAIIDGDIEIKADAFMGSIEIILPPNVKVVVKSSPFLGAVENKYIPSTAINSPTVYLYCSAVLGGIEVR